MNLNASTEALPNLTDAQRSALISLLADEDPHIHETVRNKLIGYGAGVMEWLRPHQLSNDPVLRRRSRDIVRHFQRAEHDLEFLTFCTNTGEDLDVERGMGLLCKTFYPEANLEAFSALLDTYAFDLRNRILTSISPQQRLLTVNQYLFTEVGFVGNPNYAADPENCYFNRIMERKTGNPIGLCAIYLLICRRLGLPIAGIGLPGHFLCRFQSPTLELYIDCFHQGRFLRKADCIQYLQANNHGLHEGYLAPVSTRRILMRMCANLQQTYLRLERMDEAALVKRYLVALAN